VTLTCFKSRVKLAAHGSNPARHVILCGPWRHEIHMMLFRKKILCFYFEGHFFCSGVRSVHSPSCCVQVLRCFTKCTRMSSLAGLFEIVFFTRGRSAGEGAWLIVALKSLLPPPTTEEIITICTCWGSPTDVGQSSPRVWVHNINIIYYIIRCHTQLLQELRLDGGHFQTINILRSFWFNGMTSGGAFQQSHVLLPPEFKKSARMRRIFRVMSFTRSIRSMSVVTKVEVSTASCFSVFIISSEEKLMLNLWILFNYTFCWIYLEFVYKSCSSRLWLVEQLYVIDSVSEPWVTSFEAF